MRSVVRSTVFVAGALLGLVGGLGCNAPSQVMWSPDGSRGVYAAAASNPQQARAVLIDGDGHILADLPPAARNVAWSADSSTVYFAGSDDGGPLPAPVIRRWMGDDKDEPAGTTADKASAVCRYRDGRAEPLVAFANALVFGLQMSPDGRWLAITLLTSNSVTGGSLYAYDLREGQLYQVSDLAGDACFTGDDRLTFVEVTNGSLGEVVEVTLDPAARAKLPRRSRAVVLPGNTSDLRATAGHGLVFVTVAGTFPAATPASTDQAVFRVGSDGRLARTATATFGDLAVSPDGRRVLFCEPTAAPDGRALAVMDIDGAHRRQVMDLSPFHGLPPMSPAWHGNGRVTFVSTRGVEIPADHDRPARTVFDVVDYDLPEGTGPMVPAKVLSRDWPADLKPRETTGPVAPAVESPR